jgi:hypothetical protein
MVRGRGGEMGRERVLGWGGGEGSRGERLGRREEAGGSKKETKKRSKEGEGR